MDNERLSYIKAIEAYQKYLDGKICPKCSKGKVNILSNFECKSFAVACNYCSSGKWKHINNFTEDYSRYKKLVPINNSIKDVQNNSIKNALKKGISKIILKSEDVITKKECNDAIINNPRNIYNTYNNLNEILKNIKLCSRVELIVLKEITDLCSKTGKPVELEIVSRLQKNKLTLIQYIGNKSIVAELSEKLEINNLRNVLRHLMKKGIISFNEEENYIDIQPVLVNNKEKINDFLALNTVEENEIKYKVLKNNGFRCVNCFETGIPLEIAFLKKSKNKRDVSSMIPLCRICFDGLTENGVMIDGTIAVLNSEFDIKAWRFIKSYIPNLTDKSFKICYLLALRYSDDNLIKAMALGLQAYENGRVFSNIIYFYRYIRKILDNAEENRTKIEIQKNVEIKYNIQEWLKLI
jgi:hypothetical protein